MSASNLESRRANLSRHVSLPGFCLVAGLLAGALAACSDEESPAGPSENPNALITLSSPKGGETYRIGDTVWVEWTVKDVANPVDAVDPMLSADSGKNWVNLKSASIAVGTLSWGRWGWKVPDSVRSSTGYIRLAGRSVKLKVEQYSTSDSLKMAHSGFFTLTAP